MVGRITLDLTPAQKKKLKMTAVRRGCSMTEILREIIDGFLSKKKAV